MTARDQAIKHIEAALGTGVRGDIREHLTKALRAAQGEKTFGLTKAHYDNLAVGAKINDRDRPGLMMRHGKRTGKIWYFRHKQKEHQFGTYPDMSVADARIKWNELREAVQRGDSLTVATAEAKATKSLAMTMGDLCKRYIDDYARQTKRSWDMDKTYLQKHVLPHYAALPATEFTPDHVRAILAPISKRTPREAEKVRGVLSSMFNVATRGSRKIGNLDGSTWLPPTTMNPVTPVVLPKRETKSFLPSARQLETILRALPDEGDVGEAILLQAQTCARVSEVTDLPWVELDLDAGVWTLPSERAKNGYEHRVMLSAQSVILLKARRERITGDHVFPARGGVAHITRNTAGKAIRRVCRAVGVPDGRGGFTSHALRHACLTWLAERGTSKDIRDRVSNHVDKTSSDSVYNKAQLNEPAREWTQRWCDHLDALTSDKVVSISARA